MLPETNELHASDSDQFTFWIDQNGFYCFLIRDKVRTLESYKTSFELMRHLTRGKKVCLFADMSETSLILFNDRAKEYIAEELPRMFKAIAILTGSTLQKVAPTIFLNTVGEPVPLRIFDSEQEAKDWLKEFE